MVTTILSLFHVNFGIVTIFLNKLIFLRTYIRFHIFTGRLIFVIIENLSRTWKNIK